MIINNRRDAGYTIISRFEESFRSQLENVLTLKYENIFENIPAGICEKANSRNSNLSFDSPADFFENIDFPDLKEITTYKDHFQLLIKKLFQRLSLMMQWQNFIC